MLKSKRFKGVRDFTVWAQSDERQPDLITVKVKLGRMTLKDTCQIVASAWPWPKDWPGKLYDQRKAMAKVFPGDEAGDNGCQVTRLIDEAVDAVNDLIETYKLR